MINRLTSLLAAGLLAGAAAHAESKTVTIAAVNNPAMIELKKLSAAFET